MRTVHFLAMEFEKKNAGKFSYFITQLCGVYAGTMLDNWQIMEIDSYVLFLSWLKH